MFILLTTALSITECKFGKYLPFEMIIYLRLNFFHQPSALNLKAPQINASKEELTNTGGPPHSYQISLPTTSSIAFSSTVSQSKPLFNQSLYFVIKLCSFEIYKRSLSVSELKELQFSFFFSIFYSLLFGNHNYLDRKILEFFVG